MCTESIHSKMSEPFPTNQSVKAVVESQKDVRSSERAIAIIRPGGSRKITLSALISEEMGESLAIKVEEHRPLANRLRISEIVGEGRLAEYLRKSVQGKIVRPMADMRSCKGGMY